MLSQNNIKGVNNSTQDDDYFTLTIVGLPTEVLLGRSYTKRKLSEYPELKIDSITAATWHSDAAHALVKQQIRQSAKGMRVRLPDGRLAHRQFKKNIFYAFLMGFCLCAALFYVYFSFPGLQQLMLANLSGLK